LICAKFAADVINIAEVYRLKCCTGWWFIIGIDTFHSCYNKHLKAR